MRTQSELTPAKSYDCRKLSSMIQDHSSSVYLAIETLLVSLSMQINVKYNLEPYQLPDIAKTIYKQYYFYSIEEIALVLRMGSEGSLYDEKGSGKIYDRLSKDMIMTWFTIYDTRHRVYLVENSRSKLVKEHTEESAEHIEVLNNIWKKVSDQMKKDSERDVEKEEAYQEFKKKYFGDKNNIKD